MGAAAGKAWLLGAVVLMFAASSARAGTGRQAGVIRGQVLGPRGSPVAGAHVTLTGSEIAEDGVALTGADGRFRFVDVPPGPYRITAARSDLGQATVERLRVRIAESKSVALFLVPGEGETIEVRGEAPPIDATRTGVSYTLGKEEFGELPLDRRSFNMLLQQFPGTLEHPNSSLLIRGGSWIDNQLLIDGVNYSDPITNSVLTRFDFNAIREVEILSGGYGAEYGQAMGGVVNMVTRTGGERHEIAGRATLTPSPLVWEGADEEAGSNYDLNVNAGGPVGDRARYFTSVSYQRDVLPFPQQPGLDLAAGRTQDIVLGFGKVRWEPGDHRLEVHLSGFFEEQRNSTIEDLALEEAQERHQPGGITTQLSWRRATERVVFEASTGAYYYDVRNMPMSGDIDTPAHVDTSTGVISRNGRDMFHNRNIRWQLQGSATGYGQLWGRHELKAGAELALMNILFESAHPGNEILLDEGGPCDPEAGVFEGCHLSERTGTQNEEGDLEPGAFAAEASGLLAGAYVRDSWDLGGGVHVNPGWRIDIGRIGSQDGKTLTELNGFFGPRLGVAWDVGERGRTLVRAHAARTYQTGLLALSLFFGPSLRKEVYRFNEETGQFDQYEQQRSSGGDTGGTIDHAASKTAPHSSELVFGVEQVIGDRLVAQGNGVYRLSSHLYDSREQNLVWNEAGDAILGFRDSTPTARYSLLTSEKSFREYAGLELALKGRVTDSAFVLGSYTLSRLYGTSDLDAITQANNVVPFVIANPRQRPFLYGPLSSDRRHVLKLAGVYGFEPLGLTFGSTFRLASGAPYSRLYFNSFLNGYYDRRAPRGVDPGDLNDPDDDRELRGPVLVDWNLYAGWDISRYFDCDRLALELQVFNLLNRRAATWIEERNTDRFGTALQRQPPLRVTAGLSFQY